MGFMELSDFKKIDENIWEVPKTFRKDMQVPARLYISEPMLQRILDERSVEQLIDVATLRGIERQAMAMPDIHQGYGFPIGGVAAFRAEDGVISPGGVGYDINCGVRLLVSPMRVKDLKKDEIEALTNQIQRDVPSGVGRGGHLKLKPAEIDEVLNKGVKWALKKGYASEEDLEMIEEGGCFDDADSLDVSDRAKKRGSDQLGTLGAGNHFVELQQVDEIFDEEAADAMGISQGQITVMIHTGSRGLGHQICTDYVQMMNQVMNKYDIHLPNRELACAPFSSDEGQQYYRAMQAGANFAWCNRQLITHQVREGWTHLLGDPRKAQLDLVYDVAHNMAKLEQHGGKEYIVHRKGATRSFGPGSKEIPEAYRDIGQPVLIPGSMGTASYVLVGTDKAMKETFGSCCHGAGRCMSRHEAKRTLDYNRIKNELEVEQGIVIRAQSAGEILEEAPEAYKDVDEVVEVVEQVGIARKVARMKPLGVVKG